MISHALQVNELWISFIFLISIFANEVWAQELEKTSRKHRAERAK